MYVSFIRYVRWGLLLLSGFSSHYQSLDTFSLDSVYGISGEAGQVSFQEEASVMCQCVSSPERARTFQKSTWSSFFSSLLLVSCRLMWESTSAVRWSFVIHEVKHAFFFVYLKVVAAGINLPQATRTTIIGTLPRPHVIILKWSAVVCRCCVSFSTTLMIAQSSLPSST